MHHLSNAYMTGAANMKLWGVTNFQFYSPLLETE